MRQKTLWTKAEGHVRQLTAPQEPKWICRQATVSLQNGRRCYLHRRPKPCIPKSKAAAEEPVCGVKVTRATSSVTCKYCKSRSFGELSAAIVPCLVLLSNCA